MGVSLFPMGIQFSVADPSMGKGRRAPLGVLLVVVETRHCYLLSKEVRYITGRKKRAAIII